MKLSNRIKFERINDDNAALSLDGSPLNGEFIGRCIEAQYEVYGFLLVILEADLEHVVIYLFGRDGKTLDKQIIGHWYFDSIFEKPEIKAPDTLEFSFGTKGSVTVSKKPTRSSLFKAKRYLHCQGFTVEA